LDSKNTNQTLVILSFAIIYIVWGSTYLFASYAIDQIPAFRLCGYRYIIASAITICIPLIFGQIKIPSKDRLINAAIAGFVFMGLGTGGAIWSLNYLDTGLTALIIAGEPLVIVLMMWAVNRKRPAGRAFIGIFLGLFGMYLLVSQKTLVSSSDQVLGIVVILLSMLAWGSGSIFVSKVKLPESEWVNSAIQMLVGGIATLIISWLIGETGDSIGSYTFRTIYSLIYLIIFGSVAAFTAFNYLLRHVSTEKVVTNTYVNPIIAMILGYLFNGEVITQLSVCAAVIMLSGVFLINSNKGK